MFELYPPLLTIFFATTVSFLVVLYCLQYSRQYGATQQVTAFTVFATAVGVWALFAMLQLAATTYESTLLAYKLLHFGAWGTPIPLLFYACTMGPAQRWVTRSTAAALTLMVVPLFVLLFTEPTQYLFIDPRLQTIGGFSVIEHGNRPLYVAYLGWIYVIVFAAIGYIVYQVSADEQASRRQTGIVVGSLLIPVLISVGQTSGLSAFDAPGTILTPLSLSLAMSGLGYATFRYDTFDAKSRARSRTIEDMQEGYLLVSPENRVVDGNQTARDIVGTDASLAGVDIESVIPNYPAHAPVEGSSTFETRVDRGETAVTLETSASRLVHSGQVIGTLCVFRDITDRKRDRQKLQDQRDSLELLNAVMRHDIRNDLQAVIAYVELLTDGPLGDDRREEYAAKALANAESAVDLTTKARQLADVVLQNGSELGAVNLTSVLNECVDDVAASAENTRITLDRDGSVHWVSANDMLDAVFRNVLKNALKHNDKSEREIDVSVREGTETLRVTIADNGPGIPERHREAIFGKGNAGLESGGTGFGLYLVKTLVERYGGSIWVEDRASSAPPGGQTRSDGGDTAGSVFVVELPTATP